MKFVLASSLEMIEDRFNVHIDQNIAEISKSYAVSQGDFSYAITCEDPHLIQVFKYGLTPFYSTEPMNLVTARAEGNKNLKDDPNYCGSKSIFLKTEFKNQSNSDGPPT